MGLSDIYYRRPWAPADEVSDQIVRGFSSLPQAQQQYQQAKSAEATAPENQASPHRQAIGNYISNMMKSTPGHNPEYEQRLMGELQDQGHAQQGPGPTQGPHGLQPEPYSPQSMGPSAPTNLGPYMGPNTGAQGLWTPDRTMGQGTLPMSQGAGPPMAMNGEPLRTPAVGLVSKPTARPMASTSVASSPALGPMTNQDVDTYMRMAPMLKATTPKAQDWRQGLEAGKLAEKKREFDKLMELRKNALGAKKEIAYLMAKVKVATSDVDRKHQIAVAKLALERYKIDAQEQGRLLSGLGAVINDEASAQAIEEAKKRLESEDLDVQDAERQLRELENMKPGRVQKPKPAGGSSSKEVTIKTDVPRNTIRVRTKDGQTGTIPVSEFDPNIYEKL